jgi:uracil-DNA glycosylase
MDRRPWAGLLDLYLHKENNKNFIIPAMDRGMIKEKSKINEIVEGLIRRLELLRSYGVLEVPVARQRLFVVKSSGRAPAPVAFVQAAGAAGTAKKEKHFPPCPPFLGDEGELLRKIIESLSLGVEDVYTCTVSRGIPAGGEGGASTVEFAEEIKRVSPRVIVTMGEEAARASVMPTHHPSELIKNPGLKRQTWEDMKMVIKEIAKGG